jgi:116 kDa U5 small nuclear ribonucleoprotein component
MAEIPQTRYTNEFLTTLMETPELIRNVAVIGNLHHGKTLLMDMLIQQTQVRGVTRAANRCLRAGRNRPLAVMG